LREITKPDGSVYAFVIVEDGRLLIKLNQGKHKGLALNLDAKIIPQLRQILSQAEFLHHV
jgi:hypothetical protein